MWLLLTIKIFTNSNVKIRLLITKNRAQSCTHHIISNTFFKSLQNIHQNINNDFL